MARLYSLIRALSLLRKEKFDLVFLDLRLPILNGIQICGIIKSDNSLKDTPVIFFTASFDSLDVKVEECGAQGYILKPFEPEQLLEKVRSIIGESG
ncbi:MAG: response regulator [Candidatus Omnitrophica bacterium]|nr:response regulator [Candidatus Omnitrophota bacterium]